MTVAEKAEALAWKIEFGGDAPVHWPAARAGFRLPVSWLAGEATEGIFPPVRPAGEAGGFRLFQAGELLLGCGLQPVGGTTESAAREFYRRLLEAAGRRRLYRIWNYIPAINERKNGLENYRAFSAGRAQAFEEKFGGGYRSMLPAASAVGCRGEAIAAVFAAGERAPRHVENPEQVPAYHYPPQHGPRSPSFSRSTIAESGGRPVVFISGTAAIKGHATVAPGALAAQLDCTLDNLRLISVAAGVGERLGAGENFVRHFKIYLRRAGDLPAARARLAASLLRPADRVVWLQADLCRAGLVVEIEATLVGK